MNARREVLLPLLVVAACSRPPPPPPPEPVAPETVTIGRVTRAVGSRMSHELELEMSASLTIDNRLVELVVKNEERLTDEVLEVVDGAITKLKLSCVSSAVFASVGGQAAEDQHPAIRGKTYTLAITDGRVTALGADGKPASAAELTELNARIPELGKPDAFLAAIPAQPIPMGESLPGLAKAIAGQLARANAADPNIRTEVKSVILMGNKGEDAELDVEAGFETDDGAIRLTASLRGPLIVSRATGAVVELDLSGSIVAAPSAKRPKALRIDGKGIIKTKVVSRALPG